MLREQEGKKIYHSTSRSHRYYENHPEMQDKAVMLYHKVMCINRSRLARACNSHTKPMSRRFHRLLDFKYPSVLWKKGSSSPVRQLRQLVSCDWSWHSHGSLIPGKFDLKINRSMKTPWWECSGVACSYSSTPDINPSGCLRQMGERCVVEPEVFCWV